MRFTIPFQYDASFIRKGRRTPETALQISEVTVDVPEFGAADLPLAFRAGHDVLNQGHDAVVFCRLPSGPSRVWELDGTFYAERCRAEDLVDICVSGHDTNNPLHTVGPGSPMPFFWGIERARKEHKPYAAVEREAGTLRQWDDPGGVAEAEAISRRFAEAIVVDGMVCFAATEPVITVAAVGKQVVVAVTEMDPSGASAFTLRGEVAAHHMAFRFRLGDKDAALRYAEALSRLEDIPVQDGAEIAEIRAASRFAPEAENLLVLCDNLQSRLQPFAGLMKPETAVAWSGLRDACLAAGGVLTPECVSALEGLVAVFERLGPGAAFAGDERQRESWRRQVHANAFSYSGFSEAGGAERAPVWAGLAIAIGRMALSDWYRRPADGNEWVENALPGKAAHGAAGRARQLLTRRELDALSRKLSVDLEIYRPELLAGTATLLEIDGQAGPHVAVVARAPEGPVIRRVIGPYGREVGGDVAALAGELVASASEHLDEDYAMAAALQF